MIRNYLNKVKEHVTEFGEKTMVLWQCGAFFEVYSLKEPDQENIQIQQLSFSLNCVILGLPTKKFA